MMRLISRGLTAMLTGSLKAPYTTAGIWPALRVRWASFLPREARTSAATVISRITRFLLYGFEVRSPSDDRPGGLSHPVCVGSIHPRFLNKQNTHRSLLVYRADGIGHQVRDRQRFDLRRTFRRFRERNRIRYYYFLQAGFFDPAYGRARQNRVRSAGRNTGRALLHQRLGALHQRASGIDQVVHQQAVAPVHLTDHI